MTLALEGLAVPGSLRLSSPAWGIDPSSGSMDFGILVPRRDVVLLDEPPKVEWATVPLPPADGHPHMRWGGAGHRLQKAVTSLVDAFGMPRLALIEQPFSQGHHAEPVQFYAIGVLLAVLGNRFGLKCDVEMVTPGAWKLAATGHGRHPEYASQPKKDRYKLEKARLLAWAQDVAGYTGTKSNHADAIGIATAAGVRLERRERAS